jgi:DNA-binding transcriptional LysR family regulator
MFSLHQVKIFHTVATEGNISRASDLLFLSQPAVSQHIRALEKDIGVTLLLRGRRGVTLTPAGEVFLEYAQQLLYLSNEAREATQLAAQQESKRHYLHIGATPGIGACLMPHWMNDFYLLHQHLTLTLKVLSTPELVRLLAGQEIAFAVVGDAISRAVVEVTHLWDEEAVIVVGKGHPWWNQPVIHVKELAEEPFVLRENNSLAHAWELQSLAEYGVNPRTVAEFNTTAAIKQAVIAGMGIALLPCFSIKNELNSGRLRGVRLHEGVLRRPIHLLWTPASLKLFGAEIFIRFLAQNLQKLPVQPVELQGPQNLTPLLETISVAPGAA